MKIALLFASICCALLLTSCADQSLMSDEEYYARKGPAARSPDYSQALPRPINPNTNRPY